MSEEEGEWGDAGGNSSSSTAGPAQRLLPNNPTARPGVSFSQRSFSIPSLLPVREEAHGSESGSSLGGVIFAENSTIGPGEGAGVVWSESEDDARRTRVSDLRPQCLRAPSSRPCVFRFEVQTCDS